MRISAKPPPQGIGLSPRNIPAAASNDPKRCLALPPSNISGTSCGSRDLGTIRSHLSFSRLVVDLRCTISGKEKPCSRICQLSPSCRRRFYDEINSKKPKSHLSQRWSENWQVSASGFVLPSYHHAAICGSTPSACNRCACENSVVERGQRLLCHRLSIGKIKAPHQDRVCWILHLALSTLEGQLRNAHRSDAERLWA